MANLDTLSKRASSIDLFWRAFTAPKPNGAINYPDRPHIAGCYSGFVIEPITAGIKGFDFIKVGVTNMMGDGPSIGGI